MGKVRVPANFKIGKLVARYSTSKILRFNKDKVHFICDSIIRLTEKLDPAEGSIHPKKIKPYYVPLCAKTLKHFLGDEYRDILDWLINAKVIESDRHYITGKAAIGYRFTEHYKNSGSRWVTLTSPALIKKLQLKNTSENKYIFLPQVAKRLQKWFDVNRLKIDAKEAYGIIYQIEQDDILAARGQQDQNKLICNARNKASGYRAAVDAIDKGYGRFNADDEFGYRLFTPLTKISKKFRSLITYDGKPLVEVDISNSQPFFSIFLLDYRHWLTYKYKGYKPYLKELWKGIEIMNKNEKKLIYGITLISNNTNQFSYTIMILQSSKTLASKGLQENKFLKNCCEGTIYDSVVNELDKQGYFEQNLSPKEKRNIVKEILLHQLFANQSDRKHWCIYNRENKPVLDCFKALYPDVDHVYQQIKRGEEIGRYKNLCCLLQRIESIAIQAFVCKKLQDEYPDVPIFTIHDCIATTEGNETIVQKAMIDGIEEYVGYAPHTKIKYWSEYRNDIEQYLPMNKAA